MVATYIPGPHGPIVLASTAGGGAPAAKSLVLARASNQYLTRAWGSGPTDGKKITIACFFKFVTSPPGGGTASCFYDGGVPGGQGVEIFYNGSSQTIVENHYDGVTTSAFASGGGVAQDTAWHHLCIQLDSTQATASNRCHIYLDGVEVTYNSQNAPAQNTVWGLTVNGDTSYIGALSYNPTDSFNAKFAYYYLIDGQALTPSSFTSGTGAGTTHPAAYGGTFGTNGVFMNFSGSNTNDQSGNANNWTQINSPTFDTDLPT